MKFIQQKLSGRNRTRYLFALGKEEAELMLGLLERSLINLPRCLQTNRVETRMNNMMREIGRAVRSMKGQEPTDQPLEKDRCVYVCPKCRTEAVGLVEWWRDENNRIMCKCGHVGAVNHFPIVKP